MNAFAVRIVGIVATALALATTAPPAAHAASLKVWCAGADQEMALCRSAVEDWARKSGHSATVVQAHPNASERLRQYRQALEKQSDEVDVLQIDAPWTGMLQGHLVDLKPYSKGVENQHLGGAVANDTVAGRLVAMPWFIDAGLLFYRKDLLLKHGLKPPRTWEELGAAAQAIQAAERAGGNPAMWGYVWQGRNYEGLTCNALEWWVTHGAGSFVDQGGRVTANNPQAVRALTMAAGWVGTISPKEVLGFGEEESRAVFQAGNAVFLRNWPYAWSLAQAAGSPIKGKVGVTVLPKHEGRDGRFGATLGGQQLAVSRYSRSPAAAADLVMHLTSAEVQKARAIQGSFNPTLWPLYADNDILKANPFMGELFGVLAFATARPSGSTGAYYFEVSEAIAGAVHQVLAGQVSPADGAALMEKALLRIGRNGQWK
jgi:trehalose/maltose transport system substrate-binding protein